MPARKTTITLAATAAIPQHDAHVQLLRERAKSVLRINYAKREHQMRLVAEARAARQERLRRQEAPIYDGRTPQTPTPERLAMSGDAAEVEHFDDVVVIVTSRGPEERFVRGERVRIYDDPIERLFRAGKLDAMEVKSARDIENAFTYIAGSMMGRGSREMEKVSRTTGEGKDVLPAHYFRYRRWANFWVRKPDEKHNLCREVIVSAIIDGESLSAIDRRLSKRSGYSAQAVIEGLRHYSALAGWAGRDSDRHTESALRFFRVQRVSAEIPGILVSDGA